MPQHDRIDAESLVPLAALYEALPGGFNAIPDIVARRETLYGMLAQMTADLPPNPHVALEDISITGPAGELPLRIYRPASPAASRPGILFIHGGGMVLGNLETGQWREVESPLSRSLMALTFRDTQHGMAVGLEGAVMETRDGGLHWDVIDVGLRDHLFDVAWLQEQGVWFVTGALGRWASGDAKGWQSGTLDAQNLSWHVRALPVAGGLWLAGADIGRWDGKAWSLLKP